MPERLTPEQRSRNMSRIRAADTGVEVALRRELHKRGLRFRKTTNLPGRPDIVFPRARLAVFVDGCFWHRCPEHYQQPVRNAEYWRSKAASNCERDLAVATELRNLGWGVVRIWEHEIEDDLTCVADRIVGEVRSTQARA